MAEEDFRKIDEFKIIESLGSGSYATSYLVENSLNEELVLKLMHDNIDADEKGRFENEAHALKMLNHSGIPKFIGLQTYKDRPYILMSRAPGIPISKMVENAEKEGNTVGYNKVLNIIIQLLTILEYIHDDYKLNHRDIQDANVMYDQATRQLSLIDFGFCKVNSSPYKDLTFHNAGTSRFNPPSKQENPKRDSPSHDVFAVGVLAYLLCSNTYPWTVPNIEDRGDLIELMKSSEPRPIGNLNTILPIELCDLIHSLIIVDDISRPSTSDSLERAQKVRKQISEKAKMPRNTERPNVFKRVIRCPVHGDIRFSEYEWSLINSKEFNRLRHLKQLGTTSLVYPGATHSRFSHALGAVFCASRIMDSIEKIEGNTFRRKDKSIVRIFSLMHDISHITNGHTLEDELQIFDRHDENIGRLNRLLYSNNSEVGEKLLSTEEGREVLDLLNPEKKSNKYNWAREIITSPFGADVLDYIDRDSLYCGLDHKVDTAIYRRFQIKKSRFRTKENVGATIFGKHGIRIDAEFALNSILYQRFALFLKVYTHPVKVAAGAMIGKALSIEIGNKDAKTSGLEAKIEYMSDEQLELFLLSSKKIGVKSLIKMIRTRHIYVPVFKSNVVKEQQDFDPVNESTYKEDLVDKGIFQPERRLILEQKIAKKTNVKPHEIIIYCEPVAPGKKKFKQLVFIEKDKYDYRKSDYKWHREMMKSHFGLWFVYGFVNPSLPSDKKKLIGIEISDELQRSNMINFYGRQKTLIVNYHRKFNTFSGLREFWQNRTYS